MSDPQLTPDELSRGNALICEKLLGWIRNEHNGTVWWVEESSLAYAPTHFVVPPFTDWTDAGLILEALASRGANPTLDYREGKWDCYGGDPFENFFHAYADTGPLAIRAAALEHIKVMKL